MFFSHSTALNAFLIFSLHHTEYPPSCIASLIDLYGHNSLAASLIIVFIALHLARYSNCGCMPLFAFLITQLCNHDVILYILLVLRIYIASKLGMSFLLSIMLRF